MSQKPHAPAPRIADAVPLRPIIDQQDLSGSAAERRDTYALIPLSSRSYSIHTRGRKVGTVVEIVRGTAAPGSQKQELCWRASLYGGRRADAASPEAALRDVLGIESCSHPNKVTSYGMVSSAPREHCPDCGEGMSAIEKIADAETARITGALRSDEEPPRARVERQPRACASCRFWQRGPHINNQTRQTNGACRIQPPTITANSQRSRWPQTAETDWCGMYQHDRRGAQPEESR